MKIFKYMPTVTSQYGMMDLELSLPSIHKIIKVDFQDERIAVWAFVDETAEQVTIHLKARLTGADVDSDEMYNYFTTIYDGEYALHIFLD